MNFATSGNPNAKGLPTWNEYDAGAERYMDLGTPAQVKQHLLKAQLDFLEQAQEQRRNSSNPASVR